MKKEILKNKVKNLPQVPGIYIYFGKNHAVIYVGKARNLKRRVSSYFIKNSSHGPKIRQMVGKIEDIEFIATENEAKALILENKLIKKYLPKYNVAYKDDKSYPFISITKESFPRISFIRLPRALTENDPDISRKSFLFGPYPKVYVVKQAIKKICSIFPLRTCRKEIKKDKTDKPCLNYHIGICSGPCAAKITNAEYKNLVRNTILLLRGKKKKLLKSLREEMKDQSSLLKFEEAAKIRNQIFGLKQIVDVKNTGVKEDQRLVELKNSLNLKAIPEKIEGLDISNIAGKYSVGSVVVFKKGRPSNKDYRQFKIKTVSGVNDTQMIREIAKRRYRRIAGENPSDLPDLIVVDGGVGQLNALNDVLKELKLDVASIGLAKKMEEIFKQENAKIKKIVLENNSGALHLLQHLRDEAHRFAVRYHKILRHKALTKSFLDEIPGIGDKIKKKLINYFGSPLAIKKASFEELIKSGISKNIALKIFKTN